MTRAQTAMDPLGSLHTLRLDSAWMMRLPVARKLLLWTSVPATCSSVLRMAEWLASGGGKLRENRGEVERDTAESRRNNLAQTLRLCT